MEHFVLLNILFISNSLEIAHNQKIYENFLAIFEPCVKIWEYILYRYKMRLFFFGNCILNICTYMKTCYAIQVIDRTSWKVQSWKYKLQLLLKLSMLYYHPMGYKIKCYTFTNKLL